MPQMPTIDWSSASARRKFTVNLDARVFRKPPSAKAYMKTILRGIGHACPVITLFAASACASTPVPNAKVASSEAAIRAADESGAKGVPQAALHMKLAEEQLQSAKQLIGTGANERAEYVLMRAQSDAELAIALSHTEESLAKAGKAQAEVNAVQSGMTPSPVAP